MLQTLAKIFIAGTGQTQTHEGCRWTPFTLQIHVDHTFFEDTKVLFRSILQRCDSSLLSTFKYTLKLSPNFKAMQGSHLPFLTLFEGEIQTRLNNLTI